MPDGVKFSQFTQAVPDSSDKLVGLHGNDNAKFSFADIIAAVRNGLASIFVPLTRTINNKALSSNITLDASDVGAVDTADVGVADGVASLDSTGKVPSSQLPPISSDASDITYDPTTSGLTATDVQAAIDEVVDDVDGKQSTITASGILKGDGAGGVSAASPGTDYQAPLTIDATPTINSTNPVQSGGVYTDVRTRVPNYGKGVNLLRNWYFVGGGTGRGVFPVNQRRLNSYSGTGYTIDGWYNRGGPTLTINADSITIANNGNATWVQQNLQDLPEDTFTISAMVTAVTGAVSLVVQTTGSPWQTVAIVDPTTPGCVWASGQSVSGYKYRAGFYMTRNSSVTIKAVKLELGSEQTLAHQENGSWVLNDIPDYEVELLKCQTAIANAYDTSTDTYANKSLATEQQLAYVENGTTASRTYAIGEYFCWHGLLYRAKTAISRGDTFTIDTNCEQVTAGGLNELKAALDAKANHNLWLGYREPTFVNGVATVDLASDLPSNAIIKSALAVINSNTVNELAVRSVNTVSGSPLAVKIVTNQSIDKAYGCYILVGYDIA